MRQVVPRGITSAIRAAYVENRPVSDTQPEMRLSAARKPAMPINRNPHQAPGWVGGPNLACIRSTSISRDCR